MDTGLTPHDARPAEAGSSHDKFAEIARGAWRELGFWCGCDTQAKRWLFRADRNGIEALVTEVRRFIESPEAGELGEHVHLGPFSNLRLIAGESPAVTWRGIAGTRKDFESLAEELQVLAREGAPGLCELGRGWANGDSYRLLLSVEEDGFDPATAERV